MAERPMIEDCWIVQADIWPERGRLPPGGSPFRFSYAIGGSALSLLREAAVREALPAPTTAFEAMERDRTVRMRDGTVQAIGASMANAIIKLIGDEMAKRMERPALTLPAVGDIPQG